MGKLLPCPSCGCPVGESTDRCPKCRKILRETAEKATTEPTAFAKGVGVVAASIVFCFIVWLFYSLVTSYSEAYIDYRKEMDPKWDAAEKALNDYFEKKDELRRITEEEKKALGDD